MLMLLTFSIFLNQASVSAFDPISFSFPSFNSNSCDEGGDLICSGSAVAGDGYLDITPRALDNGSLNSVPTNTVGRVLYKYPVLAWPAGFSTTFDVRISTNPNATGFGEGMTFIMAPDSSPSPANSHGSFLGLLNRSTEGSTIQQLAVELDTFQNNEFDPDDNHVGIDTVSIKSVVTSSLNNIGVNLKSGRWVKVKIDYDGWGEKLQISVAYAGSLLVSVLSLSIKMSKTVPNWVYVGFTGSTGLVSESHQILNWVFTSFPLPNYPTIHDPNSNHKIKDILVIIFPVLTGVLLLAICTYGVVKTCRPKCVDNSKEEDIESRSRVAANGPKIFSFKELSKATNNFSKENLVGAGGFGSVYRGIISDSHSTVAVKKISAASKQGEREYLAEICTIGRLRHINLVQLLGWCHEHHQLLLVYEFMPNGSLDRFICNGSLDWHTRYKILTGLASALLYLHKECGSAVVHRDVKPNNVMLDSEYNAHLGDFGLARLLPDEASLTTNVAGTLGYLAPECGYTGKATLECDVFSFGIVVLEVLCGRRCISTMEEKSLVDHVWGLHGKGELLQCVDPKLKNNFNQDEMLTGLSIGLACSHPDPSSRPSVRKVVQLFVNPNEPLMDLPKFRSNSGYLPSSSVSSVSTTNLLGLSIASSSCSSMTVQEEAVVQYGRKRICRPVSLRCHNVASF
ncbi:L-type lectin-domain containing receptor kinase IX.1-like [Papaver somniferum]|uniref:L-type lectin-domain containing receptor kinase IX.1-like n=1 Tax=Papaver somniferum TaxID=3469 RepID=UPI000E7002FE|nr:L-type lectin-domain containing receptor kinase IX.1-like [Papaver somniferum]